MIEKPRVQRYNIENLLMDYTKKDSTYLDNYMRTKREPTAAIRDWDYLLDEEDCESGSLCTNISEDV